MGAFVVGIAADRVGAQAAIAIVAALTAGSGLVVLARMRETRRLPGDVPVMASETPASA